jgi:Tfp pilus assembly protein PilO
VTTTRSPFWRRRLLPAFLVLAVVNLVVLAGWTVPRTLRLRNATARVEAARETVARVRKEASALEERERAIEANAADLKRFYTDVIGAEDANLLPTLREIEEMSRGPGLQAGPRRFEREAVPDAAVERVAVTVPLQGSYDDLVGFLRDVEGSSRFLTIDGISLSSASEGEANLQIALSAYMRLPAGMPMRKGRGVAR